MNSSGIPQAMVRVEPPDVGGGFGYKCRLQPEVIAVAWLALTRKAAIRWSEDRRQRLTAGAKPALSISRCNATPAHRGCC